ncbi:MAG: hypothetical protein Gyms2KO_20430 [Gymnodinialimonas sp.]
MDRRTTIKVSGLRAEALARNPERALALTSIAAIKSKKVTAGWAAVFAMGLFATTLGAPSLGAVAACAIVITMLAAYFQRCNREIRAINARHPA